MYVKITRNNVLLNGDMIEDFYLEVISGEYDTPEAVAETYLKLRKTLKARRIREDNNANTR